MVRIARGITQFSSKKIIDALFKKARRVIKHPGIHILIAPTKNQFSRILIIASRKVGNAIKRNKIRRRIRSIFYENKLFERGFDCIAIIKPGGAELSFLQLQDLLLLAYKQ